ncbi:D-alanine--D-alanine ligase family protein [Marinoscillum furvescens]|uniref:D-alanine--D-alanine ligase n=1 Tax=Marinoscillum furvescens DSM 4134 TaxID=1122208 RepID=A0A3D9KZU1_MARFU|nr:D-alanine--D-alanine ligase [Marinoscillum furvescens]RED96170.1 D-alanine-D-alanine ligase [Marinoscillum furvescens DSM 4134]
MRIGILFGGQSREREISFAGGRTVYDNLNKALFTPVPIFIDSLGNFILLDWKYLYKGTIRDFYPAAEQLPPSPHFFQIYAESLQDQEAIDKSIAAIGKKLQPDELSQHIDFAFLALHGPYGEDGNIQGILEWYNIPYTGAGILPSSIGIDKEIQKAVLASAGFDTPAFTTTSRTSWVQSPQEVISSIEKSFSYPVVVKAPHQGSSIGVAIAKNQQELIDGINRAFFIQKIAPGMWKSWSDEQKRNFLLQFTDIREGLGFPVLVDGKLIHHPEELWLLLDESEKDELSLESPNGESGILIESFIKGKEFSCIVIADQDNQPLALPPTEIRKSSTLFDYRSKYLPGISRKITPIELPETAIQEIMSKCERLFTSLHSQVYARLDGFYTEDGAIYLNDPNTTSGMLPSSFFFHQAAEIGLNPSQFLTYIIAKSLEARTQAGKHIYQLNQLRANLNGQLKAIANAEEQRTKVAVIMGGFSSERHISVESGRNIFEKLASSDKYLPIPIFLTGNEDQHELYQLPVNIMLKDNADDIRDKIKANKAAHPVIDAIRTRAAHITDTYASGEALQLETLDYDQLAARVDFAFIALHGRPGEDGAVQQQLEQRGIPYNGSGVASSQVSINKFETNERLRKEGILVADHLLVHQEDYQKDKAQTLATIAERFPFPLIAKPADDGCSSAVKKIKSPEELEAFCEMMFRDTEAFPQGPKAALNLKDNEEFPQKNYFLVESLIGPEGADRFLEITGGMLTRLDNEGNLTYEVFEPSEALASGEVLSLEEKFLAGEGQNITPARFGDSREEYQRVAKEVKQVLEKTARVIGVEGYCRIDAFVRIYPHKVETIIIEINSLPGMTPATAIFHQSALNNMKPYEFIDEIIAFGFARKQLKTPIS